MLHSDEQLVQTVMMIHDVCAQDIVVVVDGAGEVSIQFLSPRQLSHLRCVSAAAPCVARQIEAQVIQDVGQIRSSHPCTWKL